MVFQNTENGGLAKLLLVGRFSGTLFKCWCVDKKTECLFCNARIYLLSVTSDCVLCLCCLHTVRIYMRRYSVMAEEAYLTHRHASVVINRLIGFNRVELRGSHNEISLLLNQIVHWNRVLMQ